MKFVCLLLLLLTTAGLNHIGKASHVEVVEQEKSAKVMPVTSLVQSTDDLLATAAFADYESHGKYAAELIARSMAVVRSKYSSIVFSYSPRTGKGSNAYYDIMYSAQEDSSKQYYYDILRTALIRNNGVCELVKAGGEDTMGTVKLAIQRIRRLNPVRLSRIQMPPGQQMMVFARPAQPKVASLFVYGDGSEAPGFWCDE